MRAPRFYPHRPERVDVVETHISFVFLAGERVYKVKKNLSLPFLDYSTLERRRHFCEEEVRLNRRLAPDTYIGVRSIVRVQGGFRLGAVEEPNAVEYAVEMHRLPEGRTLERLVRSGEADEAMAERIARRIADFHRDAEPAALGRGGAEDIKERLDENLRTTLPFVGLAIDHHSYAAVERFSDVFVLSRRALLDERAERGHVREGHGDLRAEHIVVEPGRITVYDCVEFDERLRFVDVASDLAFLYMDLERMGAGTLATALEHAYVERSGDEQLRALIPFYACYRAWVRVKATCLRAGQLGEEDARRANLISDARSLSDVALRMVWRSRLPLVIVFCGVSASGKSTLGDALARVSGYAHLSSDLIRKELAGIAPDERGTTEIYSDSMSIRTYDELARRACAEIESGHGALVDATFARRQYRRKLLESLGPTGARVLFCECRAPVGVLERRVQARERSPEHGSDATRQVLLEQLTQFDPLDEMPARDHVSLRTDRPLGEALEDLELFAGRTTAFHGGRALAS